MQRAQVFLSEFMTKVKTDIHETDDGNLQGYRVHGQAKVTDGVIALDVDLGLLLRPIKAKIEERIDRTLKKRFT